MHSFGHVAFKCYVRYFVCLGHFILAAYACVCVAIGTANLYCLGHITVMMPERMGDEEFAETYNDIKPTKDDDK